MKLKIEYRKLGELIPYARNSRTHDEAQVAQIAASIKEFGFTNPVLIDADGGIIAGHGRVLAARMLKLADVPTITLGNLSEIQRRAYVIADNKIALNAGWDEELLKLELHAIAEAEEALLSMTGFDGEELSKLMFADLPDNDDDDGDDDVNFNIQYNLVFDDEQQQEKWFKFVRDLKGLYPDKETVASRLIAYIEESGLGAA